MLERELNRFVALVQPGRSEFLRGCLCTGSPGISNKVRGRIRGLCRRLRQKDSDHTYHSDCDLFEDIYHSYLSFTTVWALTGSYIGPVQPQVDHFALSAGRTRVVSQTPSLSEVETRPVEIVDPVDIARLVNYVFGGFSLKSFL